MTFRNITICKLSVFLVATALLSSCAGQRMNAFRHTLDSYWHGLRWRAPGTSSALVVDEERVKHLDRLSKKLDTIRIVDYTIVNVSFSQDKKEAFAVVGYSYYPLRSNSLRSGQEVQHWIRQQKTWRFKPSGTNKKSKP